MEVSLIKLQIVQAVGKLYTTISDIPIAEIEHALERAKKVISSLAIENGYARLYSMHQPEPCDRLLLYLYLYAMESWDNSANAENYMTVNQMKQILSEVEQYFGLCQ